MHEPAPWYAFGFSSGAAYEAHLNAERLKAIEAARQRQHEAEVAHARKLDEQAKRRARYEKNIGPRSYTSGELQIAQQAGKI